MEWRKALQSNSNADEHTLYIGNKVLNKGRKKRGKRNNTIKKYVVHSSVILRCEFASHWERKKLYEGEVFVVSTAWYISFSLCAIHTVRNVHWNTIHHPSLIHSISPFLFCYAFTFTYFFSDSFGKFFPLSSIVIV